MRPNAADGMANSVDPGHAAPLSVRTFMIIIVDQVRITENKNESSLLE